MNRRIAANEYPRVMCSGEQTQLGDVVYMDTEMPSVGDVFEIVTNEISNDSVMTEGPSFPIQKSTKPDLLRESMSIQLPHRVPAAFGPVVHSSYPVSPLLIGGRGCGDEMQTIENPGPMSDPLLTSNVLAHIMSDDMPVSAAPISAPSVTATSTAAAIATTTTIPIKAAASEATVPATVKPQSKTITTSNSRRSRSRTRGDGSRKQRRQRSSSTSSSSSSSSSSSPSRSRSRRRRPSRSVTRSPERRPSSQTQPQQQQHRGVRSVRSRSSSPKRQINSVAVSMKPTPGVVTKTQQPIVQAAVDKASQITQRVVTEVRDHSKQQIEELKRSHVQLRESLERRMEQQYVNMKTSFRENIKRCEDIVESKIQKLTERAHREMKDAENMFNKKSNELRELISKMNRPVEMSPAKPSPPSAIGRSLIRHDAPFAWHPNAILVSTPGGMPAWRISFADPVEQVILAECISASATGSLILSLEPNPKTASATAATATAAAAAPAVIASDPKRTTSNEQGVSLIRWHDLSCAIDVWLETLRAVIQHSRYQYIFDHSMSRLATILRSRVEGKESVQREWLFSYIKENVIKHDASTSLKSANTPYGDLCAIADLMQSTFTPEDVAYRIIHKRASFTTTGSMKVRNSFALEMTRVCGDIANAKGPMITLDEAVQQTVAHSMGGDDMPSAGWPALLILEFRVWRGFRTKAAEVISDLDSQYMYPMKSNVGVKYELISVIHHVEAHYRAQLKLNNQFHLYDDMHDKTTLVGSNPVFGVKWPKESVAYMIYALKDHAFVNPPTAIESAPVITAPAASTIKHSKFMVEE